MTEWIVRQKWNLLFVIITVIGIKSAVHREQVFGIILNSLLCGIWIKEIISSEAELRYRDVITELRSSRDELLEMFIGTLIPLKEQARGLQDRIEKGE